ncbi:Esterase estB [Serratia plymuthica]|uniref:Esterase estB n=1 Tax=Serratia plymuthica TaxID=82996 RepID=A0A2X4UL61_SERPL|nr:Esterase estB [Serratia plymuthica]
MSTANQSLAERVQVVSQRAIDEGRLVGSVVLVAQRGEVVYAGAAGYADRELQRPMRRETQFRLSSVSKPYITLAAMRMIERQKLSLDDAVSRWLPWFTPALADGRRLEIKIRHLLSHTAGLDYRLNQPADGPYQRLGIQDGMELSSLTLEQNLRLLAQAELLAEPGSAFNYSLAIDVLGAVLEQVAGRAVAAGVRTLGRTAVEAGQYRFLHHRCRQPGDRLSRYQRQAGADTRGDAADAAGRFWF